MAVINPQEMLRIVDSISRERNLDKEALFTDIEMAIVSAARKHFAAPDTEEFTCEIDRFTGEIRIFHGEEQIPLETLGRIPAQTAKQVMIQKFREDERESIFSEFSERIGEILTGTAQRYEGGALVVSIGRAEGFMPRSEQIPGEQHMPGERVRCMILDVRDTGSQVKIVLSRANPEFIRRLFEVEVPEVSERIIEIKALAREPGHRTKVAVSSIDSKVDAVGACVGVRGSRIKNIVDELAGEKIDIVRFNESSQVLIANALRPAEVVEISLCFELGRATVVVNEDQLSLAIGKRGQNVRLAARLTNWDVDILTPAEFAKGLDIMDETLKSIEGVTEEMTDRLAALGFANVFDIEEVGPEVLMEQLEEFGIDEETATKAVAACAERGKEVQIEQQRQKQEEAARRAAAEAGEVVEGAEAQVDAILGGLGGATASASPDQAAGGGSGDIMELLGGRVGGDAGAETPGEPASPDETAGDDAAPVPAAAENPETDAEAGGVAPEASPTAAPALDEAEADAAAETRDPEEQTPGEPHDIIVGGDPVHPGAEDEGPPEEVELSERDESGHPTDSDVARIAEGATEFDQQTEADREAELPGADEAADDDPPAPEAPGAGR